MGRVHPGDYRRNQVIEYFFTHTGTYQFAQRLCVCSNRSGKHLIHASAAQTAFTEHTSQRFIGKITGNAHNSSIRGLSGTLRQI